MDNLLKIRFEMLPTKVDLFSTISESCSKIITLNYSKDFFYKVDIIIKELLKNAINNNKDESRNIIVDIELKEDKVVFSFSNIASREDFESLKNYLEKLKDDSFAHSHFIEVIKKQRIDNTTGGLGLNRIFKEKDCNRMDVNFDNEYLTVTAELETI